MVSNESKSSTLNTNCSFGLLAIRPGEALRYGRLEMFSKQNGGRDNAKKLIVVITDGQSDNQTKTESEARLARLSGIHIISVGVGNAPNDKELGRIASKPFV
jgi:Mg-chelatase subunit ChlD